MFDFTHKKDALDNLMSMKYIFKETMPDINLITHQCDKAIIHIIESDDLDNSIKMLKRAADWFDMDRPADSKDPRGEADFIAIRIICALYEQQCYNKLPTNVKESLKRFFVNRDYKSIYGSENHALMFRAARLLAAQFYNGEYFDKYNLSASESYAKDLEYINKFLDFRAGRGWGEFDSLGYTFEIMVILCTLHKYAKDDELKNKCHMAMDIIMLDMVADSINELYAGAHGRSYPGPIIDRLQAPMTKLYKYYFGGKWYDGKEIDVLNIYLSDYLPSNIVYKAISYKQVPYENRERKHLHCCSAWTDEIQWETINKVTGSINKYTYVCRDYAIGAINKQDDYPEDLKDGWYAHHQQHEWELTLPGGGEHKIFTHHRFVADKHEINNRWTGDCLCSCGKFYSNKNTVVAMYNIERKDVQMVINAFVPIDIFKTRIFDDRYLFLEYSNLYISLYFDNGYQVNQKDEFKNRELVSYGEQNAIVLRVEYKNQYSSLEEFSDTIKMLPFEFDRKSKKIIFDNIILSKNGNSENGIENIYPYPKTYDCPFMNSEWDSKVINVTACGDSVVYDFINNKMIGEENISEI